MNINKTLSDREKTYGSFELHAKLSQSIKHSMESHKGWSNLDSVQCESLEMIAHKIARILNGDPNYADNWHDIAGYATLAENDINGKLEAEM